MKLIAKTTQVTHEEIFIERYQNVRTWALQMTGNDRELAEDLVQDAFIHFIFTRPDIQGVHNLDGYLYILLRNLHMSHLRRSSRARLQPFSIVEYESAEMSLRAADSRDQIKAQDELRQICHFACARKESAWVGSVLILRFFHGYYPSEIAQVLRTSRASVDQRLMLARSEAKQSLNEPGKLAFMKESATIPLEQTGFAREVNEFLIELRQMIFQSRHGRCLPNKQLQSLYGSDAAPMRNEELAHIVSCPSCLDAVNKLLGLPLLSERYPTDTLGRDQRGKDDQGGKGGDGGAAGGGGGGAGSGSVKRWRRRAREAFEHRPKELHISVNGLLQGSQKINSELSEQTLDVDMTEQIGFVEVFSELGIRLLLLNVDEQPPRGAVEQLTRIELSDRRTLELKLRFDSPWPTLHVAYADPLFVEVQGQTSDQVQGLVQSPTSKVQSPASEGVSGPGKEQLLGEGSIGLLTTVRKRWSDIGHWTLDFGLLSRPATVTLLFAVLSLTALLAIRTRVPVEPLTAADLLRQAAEQEDSAAARTDQVLHRTISFEARKGGELIAQRKIEVWQSAERGITARRLYDESGKLIAGDWRRGDGVQTIYHHGSQPRLQIRNPQSAIRNFDDAWQFSPSAKDFLALVDSGQARVEHQGNAYIVAFTTRESAESAKSADIVKATLTLSKADLHATELTLFVAVNEQLTTGDGPNRNPKSEIRNPQFVAFRFTETSFERRPPSAVAPAVFEPDAVLLSKSEPETRDSKLETNPSPAPPLSATASAGLEMEVLRQLDQVGALYGEQISLARSPDGQLLVQGVVDSAKRKGEIRQALGPFLKNPAVRFGVETAEEAQQRQARQARRAQSEGTESVTSVEVEQERATPADGDLRTYFSAKGMSGPQLEQEIRRFSDRALAHARQARRHALALKQIVERFSAEDVRTMDEGSRQQWHGLINQHARAIQQESESLRRELLPIFLSSAAQAGSASVDSNSPSALAQAARQLFDLAVANDDLVRRSFTIGNSGSPTVKSPQFARSLNSAIALAALISKQ